MFRSPVSFFASLLGLVTGLSAAAAERRPNILLILADDLGWSDLGCQGGEIRTPNLDGLARDGMRFTQFYNNAKCTTSRASLLSGYYPRGAGNRLPDDVPALAETLRAAGYRTGMSGKWHLGPRAPHRPVDRGFDEFYGLTDGAVNYFDPARPDPEFKGGRVRNFFHNTTPVREFPADFYTTDAFADHAIATMRRFHAEGRPFFHHLAFNAPHFPLHAPPADIARYRGKYRGGWDALRRERHTRQLAAGLVDPKWPLPPADSESYDWATANQPWEDLRMATYAAMVDRMDVAVGRVLRALEELGIARDTLVIFLSDNGGCAEDFGERATFPEPGGVESYTTVGPAWGFAQNTPFRRYKAWANEGGISTPCFVRWPGQVAPGTRSNVVGHIIDLAPTCLEAAGVRHPDKFKGANVAPLEGVSLLPVLRGGAGPSPRQLCWEWDGNCAVREDRWKIVWDNLNPARRWQLFDVVADRTENSDLAEREPALVQRLAADYERWARARGRGMPGQRSAEP